MRGPHSPVSDLKAGSFILRNPTALAWNSFLDSITGHRYSRQLSMDEELPAPVDSEAGDGDQVLDLVQQGLLPLPLKSILVARRVCKHWHKSIGCLVTKLSLPFEAWTAQPDSSSAGPAAQAAAAPSGSYLRPDYVTPESLSDADEDDDLTTRQQQDDDDIWVPPAAVMSYVSAAAAAATAAAVAAAKERAAATPRKRRRQQPSEETALRGPEQQEKQQNEQHKQRRRKQLQEPHSAQREAPDAAPTGPSAAAAVSSHRTRVQQHDDAAPAGTHIASVAGGGDATFPSVGDNHQPQQQTEGTVNPAGSCQQAEQLLQQELCVGQPQQGKLQEQQRDNHQGPQSCGRQPTQSVDSTPGQPGVPGQHHQLQRRPQHPLQQLPTCFPYCTEVTLLCRSRTSPLVTATQQAEVVAQSLSLLGQLPKLRVLTLRGSLPSSMWRQLVSGMQQQQLQQRLAGLQLIGVDLPQPDVLESVAELPGLKELVLQATIKSQGLQPSHLEALACGTQLEALSLKVYQTSGVNLRLNPLMQLTGLKSLEVVYEGIFKDQRPTLSPLASISALSNLTSLSSAGLASPLLPQPNMTALINLSATGLTKRVSESALKTLSQCSSLRQIKFEAGRRGVAAVAADQLQHIGVMKQLTCVSLSLSKGGLKAGASTQQLTQLSALTRLKGLALSADHRLGFTTELLQVLAAQWPKLETLRFSSFSPLQGLTGFGAFRSLVALSLKPGTGVGKLLFELAEGLEPLENLQRLHLDFRGGLRLDHIEAIAANCSTRLQHLSLNMRASGIGSTAIVNIAQLQCLTSLQLLNATAATLAGPPAAVAMRSMKGLKLLSVQAVELVAEQAPLELRRYIADGVQGLDGLQEVRAWLGFGVEGRQAEIRLQDTIEHELPCCRVRIFAESEKPML